MAQKAEIKLSKENQEKMLKLRSQIEACYEEMHGIVFEALKYKSGEEFRVSINAGDHHHGLSTAKTIEKICFSEGGYSGCYNWVTGVCEPG
jgi:hypothetical protein